MAEGFGAYSGSKGLTDYASVCPKNAFKWTAEPTIFTVRHLVKYLVRYFVRYQILRLVLKVTSASKLFFVIK